MGGGCAGVAGVEVHLTGQLRVMCCLELLDPRQHLLQFINSRGGAGPRGDQQPGRLRPDRFVAVAQRADLGHCQSERSQTLDYLNTPQRLIGKQPVPSCAATGRVDQARIGIRPHRLTDIPTRRASTPVVINPIATTYSTPTLRGQPHKPGSPPLDSAWGPARQLTSIHLGAPHVRPVGDRRAAL